MALTRFRGNWQPTMTPWREMEDLTDRLTQMLGDDFFPAGRREAGAWVPPVNVEEAQDELVLTAELPGMKEDDIEIELENNVLTIRGEKQETRHEEQDENRRYHVWERRYGSFQRSFTLPRTVKAEDISASFQEGVLFVHMPKVPEAQGRKIQIRAGSEA